MTSRAETIDSETVEAILDGSHGDPFSVLGVHETAEGFVAPAFIDGADEVDVFTLAGEAAEEAGEEAAAIEEQAEERQNRLAGAFALRMFRDHRRG